MKRTKSVFNLKKNRKELNEFNAWISIQIKSNNQSIKWLLEFWCWKYSKAHIIGGHESKGPWKNSIPYSITPTKYVGRDDLNIISIFHFRFWIWNTAMHSPLYTKMTICTQHQQNSLYQMGLVRIPKWNIIFFIKPCDWSPNWVLKIKVSILHTTYILTIF